MSQVDYFFRFENEASAKADTITLAQHFGVQSTAAFLWAQDHVLPNVLAWRPSQDSTGSTGNITHNYLSGWFAVVSLRQQVTVLLNSTALAFALNRDGPPYIIKNNIGAIINDVACSPIFAGSHYPIGGYST